MWKLSIDIAERKGALLRRPLRSAERLSDSATARGLRWVKTPFSRSSALLVRITRADQRRALVLGMSLYLQGTCPTPDEAPSGHSSGSPNGAVNVYGASVASPGSRARGACSRPPSRHRPFAALALADSFDHPAGAAAVVARRVTHDPVPDTPGRHLRPFRAGLPPRRRRDSSRAGRA